MKHIRVSVDDEVYAALAERATAELRTVPNTVRTMLTRWAEKSGNRGSARQGEDDYGSNGS
jgi:hypothetical protein